MIKLPMCAVCGHPVDRLTQMRVWRDLRGSSSICVVALAVSRTAEDHLS